MSCKYSMATDPRWCDVAIEFESKPMPDDYGQRDTWWPEDGNDGHLYVLQLSEEWVKIGRTLRWSRRRRDLERQISNRHQLTVLDEWRTPPLPRESLSALEDLVARFARRVADERRLSYRHGDRESVEKEMFHGADYAALCAYTDKIASCEDPYVYEVPLLCSHRESW